LKALASGGNAGWRKIHWKDVSDVRADMPKAVTMVFVRDTPPASGFLPIADNVEHLQLHFREEKDARWVSEAFHNFLQQAADGPPPQEEARKKRRQAPPVQDERMRDMREPQLKKNTKSRRRDASPP